MHLAYNESTIIKAFIRLYIYIYVFVYEIQWCMVQKEILETKDYFTCETCQVEDTPRRNSTIKFKRKTTTTYEKNQEYILYHIFNSMK